MKQSLFLVVFSFFAAICAHSQQQHTAIDTIRVLLENQKLKVTEYLGSPGKDVCGPGMHSHPAHLSILLTDANVRLTTSDGKTQDISLKAGATFWSEAETHMVINNGKKPTRAYLVELKQAP